MLTVNGRPMEEWEYWYAAKTSLDQQSMRVFIEIQWIIGESGPRLPHDNNVHFSSGLRSHSIILK